MIKLLAVANQKGGVGKTTTSVNLAASLALAGKRVLLVDLDPQGNATTGSGVDKSSLISSVYEVLLGRKPIPEVVQRSEQAGFDVLPANRELAGAEVELVDMDKRERMLANAVAEVEDDYDYVIIDCPPALNLLTLNGLCAARSVLIPMQCEYYALEGLSDLVNTIRKVRSSLNPELEIEGLLRTMFDGRSSLVRQVSEQLCSHFGRKVYDTIIPRNIRLAEAPSYGVPVYYHDKSSKGAKAYQALAEELIAKSAVAAAA